MVPSHPPGSPSALSSPLLLTTLAHSHSPAPSPALASCLLISLLPPSHLTMAMWVCDHLWWWWRQWPHDCDHSNHFNVAVDQILSAAQVYRSEWQYIHLCGPNWYDACGLPLLQVGLTAHAKPGTPSNMTLSESDAHMLSTPLSWTCRCSYFYLILSKGTWSWEDLTIRR